MKTKQALIKLASLKLAINYVLRNRAMTKSASDWTNPLIGTGIGMGLGYLLSPKKNKLIGTLGGGLLGGLGGYGWDYINKPKPVATPTGTDKPTMAEPSLVNNADAIPEANTTPEVSISPLAGQEVINRKDPNSAYFNLPEDGSLDFLVRLNQINLNFNSRTYINKALESNQNGGKPSVSPSIMEDIANIYNGEDKPLSFTTEQDPWEKDHSFGIAQNPSYPMNNTVDYSPEGIRKDQDAYRIARQPQADKYNSMEKDIIEVLDKVAPNREYKDKDSPFYDPSDKLLANDIISQFTLDNRRDIFDSEKYEKNRKRLNDLREFADELLKIKAQSLESSDYKHPIFYDSDITEYATRYWNNPEYKQQLLDEIYDKFPESRQTLDNKNKVQDELDPDYEGIKPEYYWLVNLHKVLDKGSDRNESLYRDKFHGVLGSSPVILRPDNGAGYTTPLALARSLSLEPGDPHKMSEEDERLYLQNIDSVYDNYNNYDFDTRNNNVILPSYPVSDPTVAMGKYKERERTLSQISELNNKIETLKKAANKYLGIIQGNSSNGDPQTLSRLANCLKEIREYENTIDDLMGREHRHQ